MGTRSDDPYGICLPYLQPGAAGIATEAAGWHSRRSISRTSAIRIDAFSDGCAACNTSVQVSVRSYFRTPPCRRAGEIVQIRRSSTDVDRRPIGTVVTGGYPTGSRKELIEGGRVVESSVPGKCAGDGYMLYFPAWITCPAICRRSVMVFAVSCLESRRRIVSCVRIMSPSATAAITLRAESSMVDIALSA
jgi:hypothetical protein